MPAVQLESLHPELLAAYFGKTPLLAAQSHFPDRPALLLAYAETIASVFDRDTGALDHCDVCGRQVTPTSRIHVTWSARLQWVRSGILVRTIVFPFVFPVDAFLAHFGLPSLIEKVASRMPYEHRVQFTTAHPVCASCAGRHAARSVLHTIARYFCLVFGLFWLVLTLALVGLFLADFHAGRDVLLELALILIPFSLGAITVHAARKWVPHILLPRTIARIVKSPFRRESCLLAKLPSTT